MKEKRNKIVIIGIILILISSSLIIPISAKTVEEENEITPLGWLFDPNINGPSVVNINEPVKFVFTCTGWECEEVRFHIDWKRYDGQKWEKEETTDFFPKGESVYVWHTFDVGGYYMIAVQGEDDTGSHSSVVCHDIEVKGGQVDLFIDEMGTRPDRFIPKQRVRPYFKVGNKGNRDAYGVQGYIYLDGTWIHPLVRLQCNRIEVGETGELSWRCIWPDDYDDHELKFKVEGFVDYLYKSAKENLPPDIPAKPDAPLIKKVNKEVYTFFPIPTDPCEHDIWILADWGDGNDSGWVGPFESGDDGEVLKHTYSKIGNYEIKVKAKDIHDAESDWSEPAKIRIIKSRQRDKPLNTLILNLLNNYPIIYELLQSLLNI